MVTKQHEAGRSGNDADARLDCRLRLCPKFDVKKYLRQLQEKLPYVPPIDVGTIKALHKAQDHTEIIRLIKRAMSIEDVTFVVHWVPDGAANERMDAAAWVELPLTMPPYGSEAFKKLKIKMYFRKSFFSQAYDKAAVVVAHELSHVILESIEHPLRRCEKAVELTAMLLGFRCVYDSASKDQQMGGYLEPEEIQLANKLLTPRRAGHDADARPACTLRLCPKFDVKKYLRQLQEKLPYVPPIDVGTIKALHKAQDHTEIIRLIKRAMSIEDVTFVVHWVPDGAANERKDAAAWVDLPLLMPAFGSEAFKELQIKMYFRKSFFALAYDKAAVVVAHELSHVILDSIEHPLRRCEKAVELTAMLLGFSRIYESASNDQQTHGYLERDEIQLANKLLTPRRPQSKGTSISSLGALIARLRNLIHGESVTSPASSLRRSVIASFVVLALVAYAVTFLGPTLNQSAPKRGDLPNVPIYPSPTPAPPPQNTADEAVIKHLDINLPEDAKRVQTRLAELGFYVFPKDGKFGPLSRNALHEFKLANGLAPDDRWDVDTEHALYAEQPHRWVERFLGGWANDPNDCRAAPMTIRPTQASTNSQVCEFNSPNREGDSWRVQAICKTLSDGALEPHSFRFDVNDGRLILSDGSGSSFSYVRCDPVPLH